VTSTASDKEKNKMWIGVITLFPEMFNAITEYGVTGRAIRNGLIEFQQWNPRDFTHDKHRTVDDRPYGGGPGMLMMVQPLRDAIHAAREAARKDALESVRMTVMSKSYICLRKEESLINKA